MLIGVGNRQAGDDGVGLEILSRVRAGLDGRANVRFEEVGDDPIRMIAAWTGARAVLIVDGAQTGSEAGMLHRVEAGEGPLPVILRRPSSTHAIGVAEAIELARTLGSLPARVIVCAVEGVRFEPGSGFSPEVEARLPGLTKYVLREVAALAAPDAPAGTQSRDAAGGPPEASP